MSSPAFNPEEILRQRQDFMRKYLLTMPPEDIVEIALYWANYAIIFEETLSLPPIVFNNIETYTATMSYKYVKPDKIEIVKNFFKDSLKASIEDEKRKVEKN